MKNPTLSYYAFLDPKKSPGVFNKIKSTIEAAEKLGIESNYYLYENSTKGMYTFFKDLINSNSKYIIIRFIDKISPMLFPILSKLRLSGSTIIIDIPTPRTIALKEIALSEKGRAYKACRILTSVLLGSWFLYPSHKIVQYADESTWFKIGINKKIIKMGNGVLIHNDTPIVNAPWPNNELNFIGVAQLASWHGYDRLIQALSSSRIDKLPFKVKFTIVGDGPESKKLQDLTKRLKIEDRVTFTGMLVDDDLNQVFDNKHIGVSSLALYRKGINEASDLKTREYMSRGLCVMGVGNDPDFPQDSAFRFQVPNDDSIEPIIDLIFNIADIQLPKPNKVREYAEQNLSFEKKLKKVLDLDQI